MAAAAAAMSIVATTQASAGTDGTAYTRNSCGAADFQNYGDNWYIYDLCKDGRYIVLDIDMMKNGTWTEHDDITYTGGYTGYTPVRYNRDYVEHSYIRFRVSLKENGEFVTGTVSPYTYVYA